MQLPQPGKTKLDDGKIRRGSSSSESSPKHSSKSPRHKSKDSPDHTTSTEEELSNAFKSSPFKRITKASSAPNTENIQRKLGNSPVKFINRNSNSVSPRHTNKNQTTSDSDSSALLSADDKKGSSRPTSGEQKRSFLKSPFSRRKKTETIRSTSETTSSEKTKDKTVYSNNNNRGLTKTTNPGYRPIEPPRNTITRSRKGSSSSSSSSACGFQYSPRDATRTGGIQRRPDGPLMYTGHRSGSPVTTSSAPSPSRSKRDSKSSSGSRIPAYSSSRSRRTSSGSESEPGVAVEISDENLSEYRAKAIRGGGGKIPAYRGQHSSFLAQSTQISTSASTLPTSTVQNTLNKEIIANLTKGKSNSLPNAQTQRLKHGENNTVIAKRQRGEIKAPSPVNTKLPMKSGESAPKSPDTISVKSSSSQKSHRSTTSGSQRSSTGSIQSVINCDRSRSGSPQKSLSGSTNSINSHKRAFVTTSLDSATRIQASPPRRHSNYIEPDTDISKRLNRISLVEYENPPVSLEYRTIVKSDSLDSKKRSSPPSTVQGSFAAHPTSSPAAAVAVAAASCQTDENVTGLGLRGEDLAEINTDTRQLVGTISEVSYLSLTTRGICSFM